MNLLSMFLAFSFLSLPSWAQTTETPVYETVIEDVIFNSSSRTVIDEETIRQSRSPDLTTLISGAANIAVTSTSFQPNSIFVRGGDAAHVLIVLDGIPFYDATTSQRTLNLNTIDIKSVRRIEIIKGSQTVLYGGQALTAVIKIDTIPKDFESKTGVQAVAGQYDYRDLSFAHFEPTADDRGVVVRGRGTWKMKPSPVEDSTKTYESNSTSGEISYLKKGETEFVLKAQYLQDYAEGATASPTTAKMIDTEEYSFFTRQLAASGIVRLRNLAWSPRLSVGIQNSVRTFQWPDNASNPYPAEINEDYSGNLRTLRVEATPLSTETSQLVVGASYAFEEFIFRELYVEKSNSFNEQRGVFALYSFSPMEKLDIFAGGRLEQWGSKEPVSSVQLGATYYKTKLEFSTGYKIPSSFQLFSKYGNKDLKAERAQQVSATQDIELTENQNLSVTAFFVEFSELITTSGNFPNFFYDNTAKSETRGLEVMHTTRLWDQGLLQVAAGYQEPKDKSTDKRLIRRPLYNGSLRLTQGFERSSAFVELLASGDRWDYSNRFRTQQKNLPGYQTVNAAYSYRWTDGLNVFARGNNLLDNRYEETFTYLVEGRSLQLGVEAWF